MSELPSEQLKQYRDPELAINEEGVIGFYPREFYPLDNFQAFQVDIGGVVYPTSEHAYHAMKFIRDAPDIYDLILQARSPHDALKIAQAHKERQSPNWDEDKDEIMYLICKMKLDQHPYVAKKLLETVGFTLVEDSPKDSYWGWGPDKKGENKLGKIWMRLRDELLRRAPEDSGESDPS